MQPNLLHSSLQGFQKPVFRTTFTYFLFFAFRASSILVGRAFQELLAFANCFSLQTLSNYYFSFSASSQDRYYSWAEIFLPSSSSTQSQYRPFFFSSSNTFSSSFTFYSWPDLTNLLVAMLLAETNLLESLPSLKTSLLCLMLQILCLAFSDAKASYFSFSFMFFRRWQGSQPAGTSQILNCSLQENLSCQDPILNKSLRFLSFMTFLRLFLGLVSSSTSCISLRYSGSYSKGLVKSKYILFYSLLLNAYYQVYSCTPALITFLNRSSQATMKSSSGMFSKAPTLAYPSIPFRLQLDNCDYRTSSCSYFYNSLCSYPMSSGAFKKAQFFFNLVNILSPIDYATLILSGLFQPLLKLLRTEIFSPMASLPRSYLSIKSNMFWSFFYMRLPTDDTKELGVQPYLLPHVFLNPASKPPVKAPFHLTLPIGSLALVVVEFIFLLSYSSSKSVPIRYLCCMMTKIQQQKMQ